MNELNVFFSISNLTYWSIIILTIFLTTLTLGKIWKRHENARWTAGYFVLFFWGFFMVFLGYWDANTYLALFFAVGFSGGIKVGVEKYRSSKEAERIRKDNADDGCQDR